MIRLSPRLRMAAELVRDGVPAADIGTDHAYLSVYLVACGKCPRAIASDVREGPLRNAAETLDAFGLHDKIELRLSDGLDGFSKDDADDFVFAGMGGTLIAELLDRTPWIRDSSKRFIFQPMSRAEIIRAFLVKNRFRIIKEDACFDGCRPYIALSAQYDPSCPGEFPESYIYMGELPKVKNEAAVYWLTKQYLALKKRAEALECANLLLEEAAQIRSVLPDFEPYIKLR
ncbi:MAG: class I SAM-dependent methyltransferase [Oscillospiraceae bacterium]|nr:class I SAM-dependent methyltransferase [Oscillospiraceae bacterium]